MILLSSSTPSFSLSFLWVDSLRWHIFNTRTSLASLFLSGQAINEIDNLVTSVVVRQSACIIPILLVKAGRLVSSSRPYRERTIDFRLVAVSSDEASALDVALLS